MHALGLSWQVPVQDIDAAYLFQDIGDMDDDLSSLLVPDLDFTGLNDMYTPSVKKPPPVQTGEPPFPAGLPSVVSSAPRHGCNGHASGCHVIGAKHDCWGMEV